MGYDVVTVGLLALLGSVGFTWLSTVKDLCCLKLPTSEDIRKSSRILKRMQSCYKGTNSRVYMELTLVSPLNNIDGLMLQRLVSSKHWMCDLFAHTHILGTNAQCISNRFYLLFLFGVTTIEKAVKIRIRGYRMGWVCLANIKKDRKRSV